MSVVGTTHCECRGTSASVCCCKPRVLLAYGNIHTRMATTNNKQIDASRTPTSYLLTWDCTSKNISACVMLLAAAFSR